ncbi:hypothetical protein MFIFM68171_10912 [Madurella fahalii]|uniref:Septin-type G domain-containing protein n=1 Tax=Madurella fahalii TaxID=1157608 RepID=A0ABQ0GSK6_9PEZI
MRPLAGDDAHGRPRTSNHDDLSAFNLPAAPQMTYFLADEAAIGSSSQSQPPPSHRMKEKRRVPVAENPEPPKHRGPSHHDLERDKDTGTRPSSSKGPLETPRHGEDDLLPPVSPVPKSSGTPNASLPLTPVLLGASGPASVISSVSSRRNSLCLSEDLGSHTPSMRDGDIGQREAYVGEESEPAASSSMMDSGSAPQLIMPSIKMPSRRPFTDEGKRMGRLKVLIAGDSGVGKTSLIKAIVQSCEHIVHVDPITPSSLLSPSLTRSMPTIAGASGGKQRSGRRQSWRESSGTAQITEIYASTKPYPEWWSEVDDFRVLRRRKSLGDAVLDRNICFVDTPGYGSGSSSMDTITPVAQYIESHLQRISQNCLSDGDLLNLLGGEGGIQVDVVFYMVSNRLRPVDIHYLRQITPISNVILLLAQADLMSAAQVAASKEQIYGQLNEANIRLFSFSMPSPSYASPDPGKQGVYAISSAAGSDHDTMDASLLMSPDYVQPLIPTELASLVEQVFSSNGVSWLRHSAARKYVQWRKLESNDGGGHPSPRSRMPTSLYNPGPLTGLASNHPLTAAPSASQVLTPPMGATGSSYALARLADHTQREERLAQVRLANWAADLQKSLAREREQYAALARGDRAVWLAEKISECIQDGSLVPTTAASGQSSRRERGVSPSLPDWKGYEVAPPSGSSPRGGRRQRQQYRQNNQQRRRQDPLGLLEVADELKSKGLIALEVLGSLGVLGGLALWVTKHYLHLPAYGWLVGEWERFWNGVR